MRKLKTSHWIFRNLDKNMKRGKHYAAQELAVNFENFVVGRVEKIIRSEWRYHDFLTWADDRDIWPEVAIVMEKYVIPYIDDLEEMALVLTELAKKIIYHAKGW